MRSVHCQLGFFKPRTQGKLEDACTPSSRTTPFLLGSWARQTGGFFCGLETEVKETKTYKCQAQSSHAVFGHWQLGTIEHLPKDFKASKLLVAL